MSRRQSDRTATPRPAPCTTWRSGCLSLDDIEILQPAGNCYWNHVEQAECIGIGEHDRVFCLDRVLVFDLPGWIAPTEWRRSDLDDLVVAWRSGPQPPPIIAVRYANGDHMGLDGWHRANSAVRADLAVIPSWLAHEATGGSENPNRSPSLPSTRKMGSDLAGAKSSHGA